MELDAGFLKQAPGQVLGIQSKRGIREDMSQEVEDNDGVIYRDS